MLAFLGKFTLGVTALTAIDTVLDLNKYLTFGVFHLGVLFWLYSRNKKENIWWVLTLLHGLAHLYHPTSINGVMNTEYNPLPDFTVHAAQCLCIPTFVGPLLALSTLTAGVVGFVSREFLTSPLWRLMSIGGVFGTQHHMFLLSTAAHIKRASYLIWFLPYVGYLNYAYIPRWDYLVNTIGLFKWWYLAYYIAVKFEPKKVESDSDDEVYV